MNGDMLSGLAQTDRAEQADVEDGHSTDWPIDIEGWKKAHAGIQAALDVVMANKTMNADMIVDQSAHETVDLLKVVDAKRDLTQAQSVANLMVGADNFIKDSISAK